MAKERVILDVNVWISGLLWTGTPNRLIQAAEDGDLTLVTTPAIVEEIRGAFARPKFAARITALKRYSGIPIVTPKQFWDAWAKRPE